MKSEELGSDSAEVESNDETLGNSGIVYLLINEAMPGLVKIGKTTRDNPQVRIDELYNTSVPVPFECVLAIRVENPSIVEDALHKAFQSERINPKREFFKMDSKHPAAILNMLISMGSEDVTPTVNETNSSIPESERKTSEILRNRRPPLNFKDMGIGEGSVLYSVSGNEPAEVVSERKVNFRGQEMSLTAATKLVRKIDYSVGPCPHWIIDGRMLSEIYNETFLYDGG